MDLAPWADALRDLLGALEKPEGEPETVRLLLGRVQRAYEEARSRWAAETVSGGVGLADRREAVALLELQRECVERAQRIRDRSASKLQEIRAGKETARGYRRALGTLSGSAPTPYDWRI
ncbi:hypothetical protein [Geochorda subterranea]|uniref:Flagellar protein FliT n=1 Tax=Geochorda subterranea TaxID=3109564 RepID=A0ABZ1BT28_9FIRM|nr:hypothetical protein [Limnochorda sp. LNt]WRP15786.1 hypothetical protein VLY81_06435 [Limnochorda sp. LNt]